MFLLAAVAGTAMATPRKKKPRTFTHGHRQGLDRAAEHFLRDCYRRKTRARAKDFARSLDLTPEYVSWLGTNALGVLKAYGIGPAAFRERRK